VSEMDSCFEQFFDVWFRHGVISPVYDPARGGASLSWE
jgi:hypothetical protein